LDTVRPAPALLRQTVGPAGAVDGAPVKGAVLDDEVLVEMGGNLAQNGRELRRAPDHRRVDAVQVHVEAGEGLFRVDQGADNINAAVMPNAGQTDLADAGGIGIGRFNVQGDEAEGAVG